MIRKVLSWVVFLMFISFIIHPGHAFSAASASSCRCPKTGTIVKLGDSAGTVFRKCGEPDNIIQIGSATSGKYRGRATPGYKGGVKVKGSYSEVTVEGYIYEYYTTRLPLRITVIGGQVTKITVGE